MFHPFGTTSGTTIYGFATFLLYGFCDKILAQIRAKHFEGPYLQQTVMIVDDDPIFMDFVRFVLKQRNFKVVALSEGKEVLPRLSLDLPDIVLLDRLLPDVNGFDICEDIKIRYPDLPVLMFSTKADSEDIVAGIYLGADDYLPKPFTAELLTAKIHSICRRYNLDSGSYLFSYAGFTVDNQKKLIFGPKGALKLTKTEYKLLRELIKAKGALLSREFVMEEVLGYSSYHPDYEKNISFHIRSLRKKVGSERIVTVRGLGYRFNEPTRADQPPP